MSKKEIVVKQSFSRPDAVSSIRALADSLEKGEIYISQGSEYLTLRPKDTVFLEVKAKAKKDKEKFSFSINWYNEALVSEGENITISSEKPPESVTEVEASEDDD